VSYNPNNLCVYLMAAAGCLSGLGRAGYTLDIQQGNHTSYAKQADAYAQEFDQLWGTTAPTDFQEAMILTASAEFFAQHSPLGEPSGLVPASYQQMVQSVIARIKQGSAQIDAEGVSENCDALGSSGITLLALSALGEATTSSGVNVDIVRLNTSPFASKPGSRLYVAASVNNGFDPIGTIDLIDNTAGGGSLLASALSFTNQGVSPIIKSVALASPLLAGDDVALIGSVFGGESPQLLIQSAWIL